MEILLWIVGCIVTMAIFEYIVHRWLMHNAVLGKRFSFFAMTMEAHAILHHGRFFKTFDHDDDPASKHIDIELHPGKTLIEFSFVWGPLMYFNFIGGVVLVSVITLHGIIWTTIHREMHCPSGAWFSRFRIFKYLRNNHYIHHLHPMTNYCIVFPPFVDYIFGTHRGKDGIQGTF